MTRVWLGLGSNIDRARNLRSALAALGEAFGKLVVSPVYESAAVGFDGDPFYNLVVGIETDLPPEAVNDRCHRIEHDHGRRRGDAKFAPRTLDIDLLTYGAAVFNAEALHLPRDEILRYAFVLRPLAEVAPDEVHPEAGVSYATLWARFDAASQPLAPVELDLAGG